MRALANNVPDRDMRRCWATACYKRRTSAVPRSELHSRNITYSLLLTIGYEGVANDRLSQIPRRSRPVARTLCSGLPRVVVIVGLIGSPFLFTLLPRAFALSEEVGASARHPELHCKMGRAVTLVPKRKCTHAMNGACSGREAKPRLAL